MDFPQTLKNLREKHGISQKKLADAIDVSQASIGYWEKGERTPSAEAVQRLATYFNISMAELMGVGNIAERGLKILDEIRNTNKHPNTLAAHFDGSEYTEEELEEIKKFAEFVKSKRKPTE